MGVQVRVCLLSPIIRSIRESPGVQKDFQVKVLKDEQDLRGLINRGGGKETKGRIVNITKHSLDDR